MARRRRFDRRGAAADGSAQALRRPTRDRSDAEALTRQDVGPIALATAVATAVRLLFPAVWSERDAHGSAFYAGDVRAFTDFAAGHRGGAAVRQRRAVPSARQGACAGGVLGAGRLRSGERRTGTPAAVKAFVAVVSGLACGASAVLARLTGGRLALAAIAPLAVFHFGHTVPVRLDWAGTDP